MDKKQAEELIAAGIVLVLGITLGYLIGAAFPPYTVKTVKVESTKSTPPAPATTTTGDVST